MMALPGDDPNRSMVLSGPCHECGMRDRHAIDCPQNVERNGLANTMRRISDALEPLTPDQRRRVWSRVLAAIRRA